MAKAAWQMYKLIGNGKDGVIDKLNEALTA